jgi:hypothetical protein
MKFTVQMKDPDCLYNSIDEAVNALAFPDLSASEAEIVRESRKENLRDACCRWFRYGEYLEVEVDTDAGTCVVVEQTGR